MRNRAASQRAQAITAFECGNNAPFGVGVRHFADALCDPGVVILDQFEVCQRIVGMGVKTG